MNYIVGTQYEPCTLSVEISSLKGPCIIRLQVQDYFKKNTFLINRCESCYGGQNPIIHLELPLSPKIAIISIYDEAVGNRSTEDNFKVKAIKKTVLHTLLKALDSRGPQLMNFIDLAQRFAYNAAILPVNKTGEAYCSSDKKYLIKYLDILTDENGKELLTPARINIDTRIIQVAKRLMIPLTVPGRFCIETHEYSHLFENWKPEDEAEADINGLTIYLALGYPKTEAKETYRNIFYKVNTEENRQRLKYIEDFINNFETIVNKVKT